MGISLLHCLYPTSTHSNDTPVLARPLYSTVCESEHASGRTEPAVSDDYKPTHLIGYNGNWGEVQNDVSWLAGQV